MRTEERTALLAAFSLMEPAELEALAAGLASEDAPIIAGRTAAPWVMIDDGRRDTSVPLTGACLLCYGPWKAGRLATVDDAHGWLRGLLEPMAALAGTTCALRHAVGFWDDADDRQQAKREALALVREAMSGRAA